MTKDKKIKKCDCHLCICPLKNTKENKHLFEQKQTTCDMCLEANAHNDEGHFLYYIVHQPIIVRARSVVDAEEEAAEIVSFGKKYLDNLGTNTDDIIMPFWKRVKHYDTEEFGR